MVRSSQFPGFLAAATFAGAGLILAGVVALVVEKKAAADARDTGRAVGKRWVVLALVAMASYTLMVFGIKEATLLGFSAPEICLAVYIVNVAFFAAVCRKTVRAFLRDKAKLRLFLPVTLVCALFAVAANLLNVKGLELAPNPGYHEAIRSTNLLFITLLAIPLFSASLDRQKMVGVAVIVAGMILLVV